MKKTSDDSFDSKVDTHSTWKESRDEADLSMGNA